MSVKRWLLVAGAAMLMVAWAMPALAAEGDGAGPNNGGKARRNGANAGAKHAPKEKGLGVGTPLAGAIDKVTLGDDVKAKVGDALNNWRTKAAEDAKALKDKRADLEAKVKAETDKDKKKALMEEAKKLVPPTDKEQYESAKSAVKDLLNAEQLKQLDDAAKANQVELGNKQFDGAVAGWGKKGVELAEDQKTKVADAKTKLGEELSKLEAGQVNEARSLAMKAVNEVRKNVLTAEQQGKVGPAKDGGAKSGANGGKHGGKAPKNGGDGAGGAPPVEGN